MGLENPIYLFLFLFIIFCLLSYSCSWFVTNLRRYHEMRREFEEQERRRQEQGHEYGIYTIEGDGRVHPPAYTKYEMPPSYDDAVKLSPTISPVDGTLTEVVNTTNNQNSTEESGSSSNAQEQQIQFNESRLI